MLEELVEKYKSSLAAKADQLKVLVESFQEVGSDAEEEIRLIAHSLYGSGSTYGFPEISEAAREL